MSGVTVPVRTEYMGKTQVCQRCRREGIWLISNPAAQLQDIPRLLGKVAALMRQSRTRRYYFLRQLPWRKILKDAKTHRELHSWWGVWAGAERAKVWRDSSFRVASNYRSVMEFSQVGCKERWKGWKGSRWPSAFRFPKLIFIPNHVNQLGRGWVFALAGTHRIWFLHSFLFFLSMFWVSSRSFQSNASGARKKRESLGWSRAEFPVSSRLSYIEEFDDHDFRP